MPKKKREPAAADASETAAAPGAAVVARGAATRTRRQASGKGSKPEDKGPAAAAAAAAAGGVPPAAPAEQPPPQPPPAKKRKAGDRLKVDGGTTSAAAALAAENEEEMASPRPLADAVDAMDEDRGGVRSNDVLMEAVIKVFTVHSEPNFSLPWQRKRQFSSSGSGFIIEGRRILTNAHCVDHHTQVKVKRRGSDAKFVASVLSVGTECDIAMLTVEDESFWEGLQPVHFGTLPRLQDSVTVIGYPIGGDTMSVTSGVVSRIEVTPYVHGTAELLGIQVDAAINSGNSGGPAFNKKGECVGIAFQSLKSEDTENISYIIPTPVINHFINDYERHGHYTGFPALGIEWQKMESPVLRSALGMKKGQRGVLVRRVEPTSAASAVMQQGDILLSFDRVEIGNDGTVPFRSGERIGFSYLISQKYTGDEARLSLLRDGQQRDVTLQLKGPRRLIPVHINNRPPSYYIVAGLVFTVVTVPFLKSEYGKEFDFDAPVKLLDKMLHAMAENESQQVVVLSQVLASDVTVGFEEIINTTCQKVNGVAVNNLRELVQAVESAPGPFTRFDLDYNQVVILDKSAAQAATPDILAQHCIPHDRSQDLREGAGAGAGAGQVEEEEDNPGDREAGAAEAHRGGFAVPEPSD